jgi:hypothetical protein
LCFIHNNIESRINRHQQLFDKINNNDTAAVAVAIAIAIVITAARGCIAPWEVFTINP